MQHSISLVQIGIVGLSFALYWNYGASQWPFWLLIALSAGVYGYCRTFRIELGNTLTFDKSMNYWFLAFGCIATCLFGVFEIIPRVLAVYLCLVSIVFLVDKKYRENAFFIHAICWASFCVSVFWPIVSSRLIELPALSTFTSGVENTLAWFAGNYEMGGPSSVHSNREGGSIVHASHGRSLLMSAENLQLLVVVLLTIGAAIRNLLLGRNPFLIPLEVLVAASVCGLYSLLLWQDVRYGVAVQPTWQFHWFGTILITLIWVFSRVFIERSCSSSIWRQAIDSSNRKCVSLPNVSWRLIAPVLILMLGASNIVHDPGIQKAGRIIIDEFHSDWEKSDLPVEPWHYGVKTVYNYAFMKSIFENQFSQVSSSYEPITSELLSKCDVLVLKTPTRAYSSDENVAIKAWVENGGGLWLIGDHTNIFGMNTHLNQVAENWGIRFNADAVNPLNGYYQKAVELPDGVPGYHQCGSRSHDVVFSKPFRNHPIIEPDSKLLVLTSCSVSAPIFCEHISIARGCYSDQPSFGNNSFFGDLVWSKQERFGAILQNVAVKSGKGRVAVWSDSTLFSNFSMCMTGVPTLSIRYVDWLNRRNTLDSRTVRIIIASVLVLCLIMLCLMDSVQIIVSCLLGMGAILILLPIADVFNTLSYPKSDVTKGFEFVWFDQENSNLELPGIVHTHEGEPQVFESFFIMMQRLGMLPIIGSGDMPPEAKLAIYGNLKSPLTLQDQARLADYLESGGTLLVMADSMFNESINNSNDLIEGLGGSLRIERLPKILTSDLFGDASPGHVVGDVTYGAVIEGTTHGGTHVLLRSAHQDVLIASEAVGNGKICLCSASYLLSNQSISEPSIVPNYQQATRIWLCLNLVSQLSGVKISSSDDSKSLKWEQFLNSAPVEEAQ